MKGLTEICRRGNICRMEKKKADSKIIQLIYKLADDPSRVKATQKAIYDMLLYNLTIPGICEAIREWIEAKEPITQDVTSSTEPHIKQHVGKVHYIMKPKIDGQKIFLKVGIEKDKETGEYMMIISSHT
jgi:hypothetical protein